MAANTATTENRYAIIGGGPSGLAGARNLQRLSIPFTGFETHSAFGGLWDISNPRSTVYESAHLISSKTTTEFSEFPMPDSTPDYPGHAELKAYFQSFGEHFGLDKHYRFNTAVEKVVPENGSWRITANDGSSDLYRGVIIANGTLAEPNIPEFAGEFSGEIFHSSRYKSADVFAGKRVLVIGAGNSGCDIAVDAIHRAARTSISVRRGYHFVPKYVFGRPADTMGGLIKLPRAMKQKIDSFLLKFFTGDPQKLGFPEPDHALYESHPIVNTLVLYHLGHGDIDVQADIERFEGKMVHFRDGSSEEYDLIVMATGYKLHYPFIDKKYLCWSGACPQLYLNCFHPEHDNLFVLGLIEAAGLGWQGRYELAELMARYIAGLEQKTVAALAFQKLKNGPLPDLSGGYKYLKLDRMSYYVHKDTYRNMVRKQAQKLKQGLLVTN